MVIYNILRPSGIFYGHLVILKSFGIFLPALVYCAKNNLATLLPPNKFIPGKAGAQLRTTFAYLGCVRHREEVLQAGSERRQDQGSKARPAARLRRDHPVQVPIRRLPHWQLQH
jgi:hypothetical protein